MKDPTLCLSPSPAGPPGQRKQFGALHLTGMSEILTARVCLKMGYGYSPKIDWYNG